MGRRAAACPTAASAGVVLMMVSVRAKKIDCIVLPVILCSFFYLSFDYPIDVRSIRWVPAFLPLWVPSPPV